MADMPENVHEKRMRKLWEAAEEVGKLRDAGNPRELSNAITCRNDAVFSLRLLYSVQNQRIKRLEAREITVFGTCWP